MAPPYTTMTLNPREETHHLCREAEAAREEARRICEHSLKVREQAREVVRQSQAIREESRDLIQRARAPQTPLIPFDDIWGTTLNWQLCL